MIFNIVLSIFLVIAFILIFSFRKDYNEMVKKNAEEHSILNNNDNVLIKELSKITMHANKADIASNKCVKLLNVIKDLPGVKNSNNTEFEKLDQELITLKKTNKELLSTIAKIKRNASAKRAGNKKENK